MSRRSPNEGSIYRTEHGWTAEVSLRGSDGRRVRRKRRARTRTEANRLLREMKTDLAAGGLADERRRVTEALEAYWQMRQGKGLAAKTLELDRWMLDLIAAGLGRRRVSKLTVADCDQFLETVAAGLLVDGVRRKPLGRTSLSRLRGTLIAVVRNDVRLGFVNRNLAELSVLPADLAARVERRALTADRLASLCSAADGAVGVLIDLVGRNGLRPAEARAVRWSSIDFTAATLTVSKQMNSSDELVAPKTKRAGRTIRVDASTLARLEAWRSVQVDLRIAADVGWHNLDIVASTASGTPVQRNNFNRSLRALCTNVGIEPAISPYELRHTAISLQAEAGHSAWQIADWAGTSEKMISDVYRHKLTTISTLGPAG